MGTNVDENNDTDVLAVGIEYPKYVFGLHGFENFIYRTAAIREGKDDARSMPGDLDLTIYSLRKFAKLAAKGNPTVMTLLFAPYREVTTEGVALRANANIFASKQVGKAFLGYLRAQRHRLEEKGGSSHGKRLYLVDKYGFDTKFAYHMIRLAIQGSDFMRTGQLIIPMREQDRQLLLKVRTGGLEKDTCLAIAKTREDQLIYDVEHSFLPDQPDEEGIEKLVQAIYTKVWIEEGLIETEREAV